MDPFLPIVPSIVLGGVAYLLREKLPWWSVPVAVFFLSLFIQLMALSSYFFPLSSVPPLEEYLVPMVVGSIYLSTLSLIFTLVAVGVSRYLSDKIPNDFARYTVSVYISLLLFQLWVEVLPWTFEVLYRLYSS